MHDHFEFDQCLEYTVHTKKLEQKARYGGGEVGGVVGGGGGGGRQLPCIHIGHSAE